MNSEMPGAICIWLVSRQHYSPFSRGKGAANLRAAGPVPGDMLVSSVSKAWAAQVGATQVHLYVVESNCRAKRCYERAGFRATGRQGVIERTGDVEIEMT